MRDAFAVLFFVSVGMVFDPKIIVDAPGFLLALLAIILLAKPLAAAVLVWLLRYSVHTALTVAIALAQIGEFSFILASEAQRLELLPKAGHSLLVACALLTITVNPLLFRSIEPGERWLRRRERLWELLSRRSIGRITARNLETTARLAEADPEGGDRKRAVVVGFGPVGKAATRVLGDFGTQAVVVDLNVDTIRNLAASGSLAIFGDAARRDILEAAGIRQAHYLLITIPDLVTRTLIILAAKDLNAAVRIITRARYLQERAWLQEIGADVICTEEAETTLSMAAVLLREMGADEDRVRTELESVQRELGGAGTDISNERRS
jgi:CPA2 family monovalent cation:H+ antiporter-2